MPRMPLGVVLIVPPCCRARRARCLSARQTQARGFRLTRDGGRQPGSACRATIGAGPRGRAVRTSSSRAVMACVHREEQPMSWDPQQYLKFGGERLRPAYDLLARIPLREPRTIVDLGCGTGAVTALLHARWPAAHITGVDNSSAMLERARATLPTVEWVAADLAHWAP